MNCACLTRKVPAAMSGVEGLFQRTFHTLEEGGGGDCHPQPKHLQYVFRAARRANARERRGRRAGGSGNHVRQGARRGRPPKRGSTACARRRVRGRGSCCPGRNPAASRWLWASWTRLGKGPGSASPKWPKTGLSRSTGIDLVLLRLSSQRVLTDEMQCVASSLSEPNPLQRRRDGGGASTFMSIAYQDEDSLRGRPHTSEIERVLRERVRAPIYRPR